jgi:hypothetical protein
MAVPSADLAVLAKNSAFLRSFAKTSSIWQRDLFKLTEQ